MITAGKELFSNYCLGLLPEHLARAHGLLSNKCAHLSSGSDKSPHLHAGTVCRLELTLTSVTCRIEGMLSNTGHSQRVAQRKDALGKPSLPLGSWQAISSPPTSLSLFGFQSKLV